MNQYFKRYEQKFEKFLDNHENPSDLLKYIDKYIHMIESNYIYLYKSYSKTIKHKILRAYRKIIYTNMKYADIVLNQVHRLKNIGMIKNDKIKF